MDPRRWDIDARHIGIASGAAFAPGVRQLLEHMGRAGWTAEDPDAHLLPHLREVLDRPDSPWRLRGARPAEDGVYVIEADYTGSRAHDLLRDAVRLLSVIAEPSFHVRQVDPTTIECATGVLDGDGPFAAHGHLIRLCVRRRQG